MRIAERIRMHSNGKKLKILLIENNADERRSIIEALAETSRDSFLLEWADTLETGLALLGQNSVDLVFLDLSLPDSRGMDSLIKIRAGNAHIPVIIIAEAANEALASKALEKGAQDYLLKNQISGPLLLRSIKYSEMLAERENGHHANTRQINAESLHILSQTTDGIVLADKNGTVRFANPAALSMLGTKSENLIGHKFEYPLSANGKKKEITLPTGNGKKRLAQMHVSEILCGEEALYLISLLDVTERHDLRKALGEAHKTERHLSHHDILTDLPNRQTFYNRLNQAITEMRREGEILATLFLDIDRFKFINDSLGYSVGDLLLQVVAKRIRTCVRESKALARLGGDKFTIVLHGIETKQDAIKISQRILRSVAQPISLSGQKLFVTASLGISIAPDHGLDADTLMKNADIALSHSKAQGGNTYRFFMPAMDSKALHRVELENHLREALVKKEFLLHYQPQIDLFTDQIIGVEALIRWQHPQLGLVPPMEFIPIAEENGMIVPIGEWVLQTACTHMKAWQSAGLAPTRIAVNLSARQFRQANLAETVRHTLEKANLAPDLLDLELTETNIMHNPDYAIATLQELKKMGVHISIDDFGTGYSSLSYLKRFPIDTLKIDRSFVQHITTDPNDTAIATAIIAMAHNLELNAIAEGVETEDQLNLLRSLSCDAVQGYLYSPPVPAETLAKILFDGENNGGKFLRPLKPGS